MINKTEGWDIRAWDNVYHYFIKDKAICGKGVYHPPYFDRGVLFEEKGYCVVCSRKLKKILETNTLNDFIGGLSW